MDVPSQTLNIILHIIFQMHDTLHNFKEDIKDDFCSIHESLASIHEKYTLVNIMNEYHQEVYVWYVLEDDCDDWYMDSFHFWDDNHFHLLFDDSTPPSIEHINVTHQELVMIISV
jgi:hypothetical protein